MSIIYNGYVTKFKYELLNEINVDHCAIWFLNCIKVCHSVAKESFKFTSKSGKSLGAIAYYTLHSQTLYAETKTNKVHNTLYIVECSL